MSRIRRSRNGLNCSISLGVVVFNPRSTIHPINNLASKSRNGQWRLKFKSRADRFTGKLRGLREYLRKSLNQETKTTIERVKKIVIGWVNYHAISDNQQRVKSFILMSERALFNWINRKGGKRKMNWTAFGKILREMNYPKYFKTTSMFNVR